MQPQEGRTESSGGDESDTVVSRNPATLSVVGEVPRATPDDVERAVAAARAAQPAWAERPVDRRVAVLDRLREVVMERREQLVETVTAETGRPRMEVTASDLGSLLGTVDYLVSSGPDVLEEPLATGRLAVGESTLVREPLGVVGVISPWNIPLGIPAAQVLPALVAGNAVVLKPAEQTPLTADLLGELLVEAGLPEDVLRVVQGPGPVTGQALVEADVDHVDFTGSTEVGNAVRERCAARGVPTCLELGGSDPAVVLADADLSFTADGVVWGRFAHAGQACCVIKRLYAHRSVADDLRERIVDRVTDLRVGGDGDGDYDYEVGPLVDADAVDRLHDQVRRSVEMGAEVRVGGEPLDREGHFYAPTVLTGVTHEMPVMTEETFGPVLPVVPFDDVDEAVELANDTPYGLDASVWTRDTERGERVARRIDAGTVYVNEHLYTFGLHATPWGGYGDSSGDLAHGRWSIEAVTRTKHVHVAESGPARSLAAGDRDGRDLWWFPYGDERERTLADALELGYGRDLRSRLHALPSVLRAMLRGRDR